jgi:hypothetical protein
VLPNRLTTGEVNNHIGWDAVLPNRLTTGEVNNHIGWDAVLPNRLTTGKGGFINERYYNTNFEFHY